MPIFKDVYKYLHREPPRCVAEADAATLDATIWMTPVARRLDEVVIYGGDARHIVEEALKKIPANYPLAESMMSAFYRETVQKGQRYIGISEAMMDVYKTSYARRDADRDYWKDYNIIEPTESLENAVKKLRKQL